MKHFTVTEEKLISLLKTISNFDVPNRTRFDLFLAGILETPRPAPSIYHKPSRFMKALMASPYFSLSVGALAIILTFSGAAIERNNYVSKFSSSTDSVLSPVSISFLSDEEIKNTNTFIRGGDEFSENDLAAFRPDTSELPSENTI